MATDPFSSGFSADFGAGSIVMGNTLTVTQTNQSVSGRSIVLIHAGISATQNGQTISATVNSIAPSLNPFSSAFSIDFGAANGAAGILAITQANQTFYAVGSSTAGQTLNVKQGDQSLVAVGIVGKILGVTGIRQSSQTLTSTAISPALPATAHLTASQSANILAGVAAASTSYHVAVLAIVQDSQIIINQAVAPALSIQSEVGDAILSEAGTTIYSELYSSSTTPTTPTTPSGGQTSGTGIGTQSDMLDRLKAVLPTGWFPDSGTPVLDGVLSGIANIWASLWSTLRYVANQKRIATATDINLDIISSDFLGSSLPRKAGETDTNFRNRLLATIFQRMGTRSAVYTALLGLTGAAPKIFEPTNANDTGGWGSAVSHLNTGLCYGAAGGYGSYDLPFQAFIQSAMSSATTGTGSVQGYGNSGASTAGYQVIGGYGVGAIEYILGSEYVLAMSDQDVYDAINRIKPIATILWVSTTTATGTGTGTGGTTPSVLDTTFVLDVSRLGSSTVAPTAYLSRSQLPQTISATGILSTPPSNSGSFSATQSTQILSSHAYTGTLISATLALGQSMQVLSAAGSGH